MSTSPFSISQSPCLEGSGFVKSLMGLSGGSSGVLGIVEAAMKARVTRVVSGTGTQVSGATQSVSLTQRVLLELHRPVLAAGQPDFALTPMTKWAMPLSTVKPRLASEALLRQSGSQANPELQAPRTEGLMSKTSPTWTTSKL